MVYKYWITETRVDKGTDVQECAVKSIAGTESATAHEGRGIVEMARRTNHSSRCENSILWSFLRCASPRPGMYLTKRRQTPTSLHYHNCLLTSSRDCGRSSESSAHGLSRLPFCAVGNLWGGARWRIRGSAPEQLSALTSRKNRD